MRRDGRHKEKESLARDILFTLAINFAVALLITLAFAFAASGIKDLSNRSIASLIISNSIGFLIMLALTFLGPYRGRWPAPLNWILAVCSLVACTAVGLLIGGAILTRTGLMPEIYFWASFKDSIGVALIISLGIGISAALYERLPSRLGERVQMIELARVTHFFAKDKLTYASTAERDYVIDQSISDLERRLDPRKFVRIHRSTMVNIEYVHEVHSWFAGGVVVRLKDGKQTELAVARDRVRSLKQRLGF